MEIEKLNPSDESGVLVIILKEGEYRSNVILFLSQEDYDKRIESVKSKFSEYIEKQKSPN